MYIWNLLSQPVKGTQTGVCIGTYHVATYLVTLLQKGGIGEGGKEAVWNLEESSMGSLTHGIGGTKIIYESGIKRKLVPKPSSRRRPRLVRVCVCVSWSGQASSACLISARS
jgi:hypothetical protein